MFSNGMEDLKVGQPAALYRFNLEAGKAAALGHTWSGATHVPDQGRKGRKEEKKVDRKKKHRARERERERLSWTIGNPSGAPLVLLVPRCHSLWALVFS